MSFAVTVLAVCLALKLAAEFLLDALPVLVPVGLIASGIYAWRWWSNRTRGW